MKQTQEKFVDSILKVTASSNLNIENDITIEDPTNITIDDLLNEKTENQEK
jgi:hypothetical protein